MSCWDGEAWRVIRMGNRRVLYSVSIDICEIKGYDANLTEVLKEKFAIPKVNISGPVYFKDLPFSIQNNDDDNPSDDSWVNQLKP